MKKILKIRFTKFERALAMQILEQEGLPEGKEDGFVRIARWPVVASNILYLRGDSTNDNLAISVMRIGSNDERDRCLDKAVKAITEELFTDETKGLKVGEMCEVSGNGKNWVKRMFLAAVPEEVGDGYRYIAKTDDVPPRPIFWSYARPLGGRVEPIVELLSDGDAVYTWEGEAGND